MAAPGPLVAHGIRRRLNDRVLFDDLSFTLEPGRILGVVGPSGCGKTTLLRALAWLDPLDAGTVTLAGRDPRQWGVPAYRGRVTYVPQAPVVYLGTPADHVDEVKTYRGRRGAWTDPRGIASGWGLPIDSWDRRWDELSGGERQRAALAIALAGDPDVLLLDEPTSALDEAATAAVEDDLRGRSCVWVSHDPARLARLADRVIEPAP